MRPPFKSMLCAGGEEESCQESSTYPGDDGTSAEAENGERYAGGEDQNIEQRVGLSEGLIFGARW